MLFILILFCFSASGIFAQKAVDQRSDKFINVYFSDGIKRVSDYSQDSIQNFTKNSSLRLTSDVIFTDDKLVNKLDSFSVPPNNVSPLFPDFNRKDTIEVLPDGQLIKKMNRANVYTIRVPSEVSRDELIKQLSELPNVLYAEPDGYIGYDILPNESDCGTCRYNDQWHHENTTNPGADIHSREAWNIYRGTSANRIAIFDSGVESTHDDFLGKVNGTGVVGINHGTRVAGMAAAAGDNNEGIVGIDWYANIYSSDQSIPNAFNDANNANKIDVIGNQSDVVAVNNSWGTLEDDLVTRGRNSTTLKAAFSDIYKKNKVITASAGNHNISQPGIANFPAAWDEYVIAVAASDDDDRIADESVRGDWVDVSAPGVDVWTTDVSNNYVMTGGTSFSTPLVTGVSSLLKGMRNDLCFDDIKNIIEISSDDINYAGDPDIGPGRDNASGHGRLNAERALQTLLEPNELVTRTSNGGTIVSSTPWQTQVFIGVFGLADAAYLVRRHEVKKTITSQNVIPPSNVWGRGYYSIGFGAAQPVLGTNHCFAELTTGRNIELTTFIYEVRSLLNQPLGWYPTTATGVKFAWAELYMDPGTAYADSFEDGFGNAFNDTSDNIDWTLRSGSTPSGGTGPSGASDGTFYAYVEASSPNYPSKLATLKFPGYSGLGKFQVSFKYHMYGASMGSLKVRYDRPGGVLVSHTTISGNQGNQWKTFNSSSIYDMWQLRLEATTGTSFTSDIAIDDIQITRLEDYPVIWTDLVNIDPDESSLRKTSNFTWWDTGAASSNVVPAYTEGWVETRVTNMNTDIMFGLSYTNDDHQWNTIDFNLYVSKFNGNTIRVYNRGSLVHSGTSYELGDYVAVHRNGSTIYFKKNGDTFYSMPVDLSKSMVADICLYNTSASLYDVRMNHQGSMAASSMAALNFYHQFDEVFGDPALLSKRPVGNDHPMDTVTSSPTPVQLPELFTEFNVYPNESTGIFNVTYTFNENPTSLDVFVRHQDTGEVFYTDRINRKNKSSDFGLDITNLVDNTYLLEFNNGIQKHVVRIVKNSR